MWTHVICRGMKWLMTGRLSTFGPGIFSQPSPLVMSISMFQRLRYCQMLFLLISTLSNGFVERIYSKARQNNNVGNWQQPEAGKLGNSFSFVLWVDLTMDDYPEIQQTHSLPSMMNRTLLWKGAPSLASLICGGKQQQGWHVDTFEGELKNDSAVTGCKVSTL